MRLRWRRANVILVKTGMNRYLASFVTSETPNGVCMNWDRFLPPRRCRGLLAETPNGVYIEPDRAIKSPY